MIASAADGCKRVLDGEPIPTRSSASWPFRALAVYSSRVLDAKIKSDRYERDTAPSPTKEAITKAIRYYVLAGTAWSGTMAGPSWDQSWNDPLLQQCEPVQSILRKNPNLSVGQESEPISGLYTPVRRRNPGALGLCLP
jgi:hypothetical protein